MEDKAVWDYRWSGQHGIGRFSEEVSRRLSSQLVPLSGTIRPASVSDPWFIYRAMRDCQPPLFVSPGFNAGLPGKYEQVITIHDLIHLKVKNERSAAKSLYYRAVLAPVLRKARQVLTVSEFSKREIIEHFGLEPKNVAMVGNGSSMQLLDRPVQLPDQKPFVLFVGNAKPHKNLELLVRAAAHLDHAVGFVLVGVPLTEVNRLCDLHRIDARRFTVLNALTDEKMQDMYTRAGCVALPSTYEGFGLAAVEAMSRATPTVYCAEAVHEVAGDTGYLVPDPTDAREYARALERAAVEKPRLFEALVGRASTFTWDRVTARVAASIWPG